MVRPMTPHPRTVTCCCVGVAGVVPDDVDVVDVVDVLVVIAKTVVAGWLGLAVTVER